MDISIIARGNDVSDSIRQHTEDKLRRLERFEKRPTNAQVFFNSERGEKKVEIKVSVAGGNSLVAQGVAPTYRSALDQSLERLARQLKRDRERIREHH